MKENDIVFFKLRDSPMSATWLIGKVEYVKFSRDGKVRKFGVSYKHDTTNGTRVSQTIERPVREVVKLMNIEDTTLLDDIKLVQEEAQRLFNTRKVVTDEELLDIASSNYFTAADTTFETFTARNEALPRPLLLATEDVGFIGEVQDKENPEESVFICEEQLFNVESEVDQDCRQNVFLN